MRTEKQSEASKINGAKSNGPTTEEGKAKSSRNSHRHNLTGANLVLLSNEDPVDFHAHAKSYLDRFAPIDLVEHNLVSQLIAASWRLARIGSWECSLFEIQMDRQRDELATEFSYLDAHARQTLAFLGLADKTNALTLLQRYQSAARRSYTSAFRTLKELQGDRFNRPPAIPPVHTQAIETEPRPTGSGGYCTAQTENDTPAAEQNSIPQIIRFLRRELEIMELPNEPEMAFAAGASGTPHAILNLATILGER
jgi:hypothetical protein